LLYIICKRKAQEIRSVTRSRGATTRQQQRSDGGALLMPAEIRSTGRLMPERCRRSAAELVEAEDVTRNDGGRDPERFRLWS
jgi:hypothetical protein